MPKIDFTKIVDEGHGDRGEKGHLEWLALALFTQAKIGIADIETDDNGHHLIDVEIQINGIDVDFTDIAKRIYEASRRSVKEKVNKIVFEKYNNEMNVIQEATDEFLKRLGVSRNDIEV